MRFLLDAQEPVK